MTIATLLDAMLGTLRAPDALPLIADKNQIVLHGGKFTWDELSAGGFTAPALFLSVLDWQKSKDEPPFFTYPQYVVDLHFAAGIVAQSTLDRATRNAQARAIAEQLTLLLLGDPRWGVDNVDAPDPARIRVEGLFDAGAETANQSLWLVTWYQLVQLDPAGMAEPERFGGFDADHFEPGSDTAITAPLAQTSDTYPE